MCVSLSCIILLADILDNLGLLINLRNLLEGVDLLILTIAFSHLELLHMFFHLFLSSLLCAFFTADRLVKMGFLR